jgi:hypothetical protein
MIDWAAHAFGMLGGLLVRALAGCPLRAKAVTCCSRRDVDVGSDPHCSSAILACAVRGGGVVVIRP